MNKITSLVVVCFLFYGCDGGSNSGKSVRDLQMEALHLSGVAQEGWQLEYAYVNAIDKWKEVIAKSKETDSDTYSNMGAAILAIGQLNSLAFRCTKDRKYYAESLRYCEMVISDYQPCNEFQKMKQYVQYANFHIARLYAIDDNFDSAFAQLEQIRNENRSQEGTGYDLTYKIDATYRELTLMRNNRSND